MVSMALVVEEKECLIPLLVDAWKVYGPTDSNSKLIAMRNRFRDSG